MQVVGLLREIAKVSITPVPAARFPADCYNVMGFGLNEASCARCSHYSKNTCIFAFL